MAVQTESIKLRTRTLTGDLAIAGRAALIYFSACTFATLQFVQHALPSPDIVYTPATVLLWAFQLTILLPAVFLVAADVVLQKTDASGRRARRFRTAVFAITAVLVLRQLQLYFGPVRSLLGAFGPLEAFAFAAAATALVWAVIRWQDQFRQFFQMASPIALVMIIIAFAQMAPRTVPDAYSAVTPAGDPANPPVFVIVADELAYSALAEGETIDPQQFPNFAALAGDSAWLTNATTNYVHTTFILPEFIHATDSLQGDYQLRLYDQYAYVESLVWDDCGSVYTCRGAVHLSESHQPAVLGTLLRRSLFNATPGVFDGLLGPATAWMQSGLNAPQPNVDRLGMHTMTVAGFEDFMGDVTAEQAAGTLYFYHVLLPHTPFVFKAGGETRSSIPADPPEEDIWSRYVEQTQYLDSLLGRLIGRLKAEGIYEESAIVITGDHGRRRYNIERREPTAEGAPPVTNEVTQVPFLVHAPGVAPGVYGVDYQHRDFAATLMDALGRPVPLTEGVSAFAEDHPDREKVFYVDQENELYWRFVRDEATGVWQMVEFVEEPLKEGSLGDVEGD